MSRAKKHVLIAEDNAFLIQLMKKELEKHGVRVTPARSGGDAIHVIDDDPPDLLLLDLLLPVVDGYGVLAHLSARGQDCPVVICSNLSDNQTRTKCRKFGVRAFVVKSEIDDEQLWPIIEKHL